MNTKLFLKLAILLIIFTLVSSSMASAGTFKDRDGTVHTWSIDETHALMWEGVPYVPFGIVFEPRYLISSQTDDNWTADEQQVAAFKAVGIKDVLVRPGKGIASVPVEAFQRVIDLLETNGLCYGIELYDSPYAPLSGYAIQPTVNRVEGIRATGDVTRNFPNTKWAVYVLCDAKTGEVKDGGEVTAVNGDVTIHFVLRNNAEHTLLIYPNKVVTGEDANGSLPDIWSDYDRHRDKLVWYLSQVKFGKGLRFFSDPFTNDMGIRGETEDLIPTSTAFRLQYSAWLSRKYRTTGDLNISWGIIQHTITSFDEAARLIPLWKSGRGAAAILDGGNGSRYAVDAARSNIWMDFLEFRAYSVRGYMDSMADALKRLSADVPVVYTAAGLQAIFQTTGIIGYDGLGVSDSSSSSQVRNAGQIFSMAEHSSRRIWIISRLDPSRTTYDNKEDLFGTLNSFHDLGTKGFFVDVSRTAAANISDLTTWLTEYSSLSSDRGFAKYRPQAIYYPKSVTQASVKRFPSGIWWLPAHIAGGDLNLGSKLAGYTLINSASGSVDVYVWSLSGKQTFNLFASDTVTLISISGDKLEVKPKKGKVQLAIGEEPMLVRGIAAERFLPIEVVTEAIKELEDAIARIKDKELDANVYKHNLNLAKEFLKKGELVGSLDIAKINTDEINLRLKGLENEPSTGLSTPAASEKMP